MIGSRGSIPAWAGEPSCSTIPAYRSSFRDWAAEKTHKPHAVMEAALAHAVRNKTEAACARSDLFEKRRAPMESGSDRRTVGLRSCKGALRDLVGE